MKLQTKITLSITLCVSLLVAVSFGYLTSHLRDFMISQNYEQLLRNLKLAVTLLNTRAPDMANVAAMDELADIISRDVGVRVTIIAPEGTVVGDSEVPAERVPAVENHLFRPEVQAALRQGVGESRRFSATVRREYQYLAMRFGGEPAKGIVRLAMPATNFEAMLQQLKHLVAVALFGLFLLLVVSSHIVTTNVSHPVRRMAHIARAIAAGDFTQRVSVCGTDEIHDLAEAINFMSGQIKTRIEEVIESRSRLEAVFSSMVEGVMVIDRQEKITLVNQSLRGFFGFEQDPGGKTPIEVIRNIDIQSLAREALVSGNRIISRELQVMVPEEKILRVHATAIMEQGASEGAVLVFHNITDLKRLENIRRDFVANVSHELRTPIASIKGYAETLLEGAMREPENAREFLSIVLQESNRLAALIDDLLDLARIESGKMQLRRGPVVGGGCGAGAGGFKRRIEEKKLQVAVTIPPDLPLVSADEKRLSQVLVNLIDNAVKYTPAKGTVTISAAGRDGFAHISVSDTGIGIPAEAQRRIFERFYRVDKARSRELGGTGLGLAIVKHIVQAHKGEVSVISTPGQGAIFIVTFPLVT